MPDFDPLVRAPNLSGATEGLFGFGNALGGLPDVFRQGQIDQSKVAAINAVKQLGPNATIQDIFGALAKAGDVGDIVRLVPDLQAGQASSAINKLLSGGAAGPTAATPPTPDASAPAGTPAAAAAPSGPAAAPGATAPRPVSGNTLSEMVASAVTGSPDTQQTVATNIGRALNISPTDPIPANQRDVAQRYVQSYAQSAGRPAPTANAVAYTQAADKYGPQFGVNPDLLKRQGYQESGYDPRSTSPKGAAGVAQFMPETAKRFGVNVRDTDSSVRGQAEYMRFLLDRYGGNEGLALAGYNWGEGNVDKWLAGGRGPPPETTNYVQSITGKPLASWRRDQTTGGTQVAAAPPQQAQARPEQQRVADASPVPVAAAQPLTEATLLGSRQAGTTPAGQVAQEFTALEAPPSAGAVAPRVVSGPEPPRAPATTPGAPGAAPGAPGAPGGQPVSISGGRPVIPQEPTPGFAPGDWQQAAQAYEAAAGQPGASPQQALVLRQKADRLRKSHELQDINGMIVNPENGQIVYEKPQNVGGQLIKPSTGEVLYQGAGLFDQDEAHLVAMRVWMGDTTAWQGLGYGRQRADNIKLINRELKKIGQEQGLKSDADIASSIANSTAEFQGRKQEQRTLGTMEARMGGAAFEARNAISFAREQISHVTRTDWLPVNQLLEKYQKGTLNPEQADLLARTQAVRNAYASVMNRGSSVTTDAARSRADELLSTASNPAVYNRVLDTMGAEIDRAINAPEQMREFYRNRYGAKSLGEATGGGAPGGAGAGTTAAPPSAGASGGGRVIRSKSEYDALPSGAEFTDENGKPWKKP